LFQKLDSHKDRRKRRLKDNLIGEIDEDMVKWDLSALSLPLHNLDQRPIWLNARERNNVRKRIQEVMGVARQRALIVANEPSEPQGRAKKYRDKIIQR
jgi:hypothetical protein